MVLPDRIVLPRIQDAVEDARQLLLQHPGLEWMVLDVADAFHNVPLRPSERRYACVKVGSHFVVFVVLRMGRKSALGIWGRFGAVLGRILASVFCDGELRCELYVDDRLVAAIGSTKRRARLFAMAMLVLNVIGVPMAWSKGKIGTSVVWIGAQLSVK